MRAFLLAVLLAAPAASADISREELKKALDKNPDLIIDALKANKRAVLQVVEEAAREEQMRRMQEEEEREKKAFEAAFANPLKPTISDKNLIRGEKKAAITIVEWSDFECSFCARSYNMLKELKKKHGEDLRVVYKHMPLGFHPKAMPSALWVQAATLQSPEKAWKVHDALFENQDKLGEEFWTKTAKDAGLDVEKMKKDVASDVVKNQVEADIKEAKKFGFEGTPGFLVNGVPVRGAYPIEHFELIIERLKAKKS
jgi:protein-disulfide isomerase